jgi:hypothetical protein
MRRIHFSVAALAVSLVGCQADAPSVPRTMASDLASATRTASAGDAGPRVVGSGHVSVGLTDDLREFTFHAVTHPDGSVTGSYRVERTDTGVFFTVEVTCMSVVGNMGWVAGIITETNAPAVRVGTVSYFWARDNGEGDDAQPDVVSTARINDAAGRDVEFCTNHPTVLPPNTVEFGNVQIRN